MTNKIYTAVASLVFVFSVATVEVQAQSSTFRESAKSTPTMERHNTHQRTFGAVKPRGQKGAKDDVPSSMDLFIERCTQAGGGLISIDGHNDCVKPSGEPIPDW